MLWWCYSMRHSADLQNESKNWKTRSQKIVITAGEYPGYWMLKNELGDLFGIGFEAKDTFYVKIQVKDN